MHYPGNLPATRPRWNGCAVAGFVLSLIPVANIAGFALCIAGFIQAAQNGQRGRGLAIAGIMVNALVSIIIFVYLYQFALYMMDIIDYSMGQEDFSPFIYLVTNT